MLSVYLLWITLVCLQLFRAELIAHGMPDAVIDVAVSGTTAALALSWDQLVAGPRRNKMARLEADISAKLDMQQQLSAKRDQVRGVIIRVRISVWVSERHTWVRTGGERKAEHVHGCKWGHMGE